MAHVPTWNRTVLSFRQVDNSWRGFPVRQRKLLLRDHKCFWLEIDVHRPAKALLLAKSNNCRWSMSDITRSSISVVNTDECNIEEHNYLDMLRY